MRPSNKWWPAVAAGLILGIAACSNPATPSTQTAGHTGFAPVNAGVLTVATNLPAPGFWDGDSPQDIHGGYEYGMAVELSKRLGLGGRIRIQNVSFDSLVAGQDRGFDLALSTINVTPQRQAVADFSVPYLASDQGVLVRAGTHVDQTNARSLQWAAQASSTSEDFLTSTLKPLKEPQVFQDQPSMFAALASKQVDAVLLDTITVLPVARDSNGALAVVGQYRTGGVYGALFPKNSPGSARLNELIGQMKADGTLDRLAQQYLTPALGKNPNDVPYLQP